jgi:Cu-Zn family superoxide dismutase
MLRATSLFAGVLLLACGDADRRNPNSDTDPPGTLHDSPPADAGAGGVSALVRSAAGQDLGTVTLTEKDGGIALAGPLRGLPPGEHGIHLHMTGRCEPPKFESAGDHWNPTNAAHGSKDPKGPHWGDLPNITVAEDSSVMVLGRTRGGTLRDENELLDADGAAVVVHAKPDDHRTQPSGNSGDRIACGVVAK